MTNPSSSVSSSLSSLAEAAACCSLNVISTSREATYSDATRFHRTRALGRTLLLKRRQQRLLELQQHSKSSSLSPTCSSSSGSSSSSSSSSAGSSAAVHRNLDATPYCDCTFLDPFNEDLIAAIDNRGRLDVVRILGNQKDHKKSASSSSLSSSSLSSSSSYSSSSSSSTLVQQVQVSCEGAAGGGSGGVLLSSPAPQHQHQRQQHYYCLQSLQRGQALAVGMPTGEFRVLATEYADRWCVAQQPHLHSTSSRRSKATTTSTTALSTRRMIQRQEQHHHYSSSSSSSSFFASVWRAHRPFRRYAPSDEWTLGDQLRHNILAGGCSPHHNLPNNNNGYNNGFYYDRYDYGSLDEIMGWDQNNHSYDDDPVGIGNNGLTTAARRVVGRQWDFCETSSSILAAHVGEDYVGVKLLDDRVDQTHVLVLGGGGSSCGGGGGAGFTTTTAKNRPGFRATSNNANSSRRVDNSSTATTVAFASDDGLLLATDDKKWYGDDAVLLWDLRMTRESCSSTTASVLQRAQQQKLQQLLLPTFPRETAHLLENTVATLTMDEATATSRSGIGLGRTVELSRSSTTNSSSLVALSALDCAMLCHKLLSPGTSCQSIMAFHDDGFVAQFDEENPSYITLFDVEQHLLNNQRQHQQQSYHQNERRQKRSSNKRLLDGTLVPLSQNGGTATTTRTTSSNEAVSSSSTIKIPIHLEDRYGCSTTLSCLAFASQHATGTRLFVGGTSDGDLFVFG